MTKKEFRFVEHNSDINSFDFIPITDEDDDVFSYQDIVKILNEKQRMISSQADVIKGYQERNEDLFDEKIRIERVIRESIQLERTCIGKNVLKQLAEALGIDYEL